MGSLIPTVELNNGISMPQLGLGVWQLKDGSETETAVRAAIDSGYRLIDTASMYGNEKSVGKAVRESGVPREELFVTTKLWNSDQGAQKAKRAFEASLDRLGLDYIDLYLIHWPVPRLDQTIPTWHAFEDIYSSGRARAIGVCNFTIPHLQKLLDNTTVVPATNQIELHPRLQQPELRQFCAEHGIQGESWSPIGGTGGNLLKEPALTQLAEKHHKSPAQIVLRWHIQIGQVVIPKSAHPERIIQNMAIFDFALDDQDMQAIAAMNTNTRRGPDPDTMNTGISTGILQVASKLGIPRLRGK